MVRLKMWRKLSGVDAYVGNSPAPGRPQRSGPAASDQRLAAAEQYDQLVLPGARISILDGRHRPGDWLLSCACRLGIVSRLESAREPARDRPCRGGTASTHDLGT